MVTELISGRTVAMAGGAFSWRVDPGDLAIFEISVQDILDVKLKR